MSLVLIAKHNSLASIVLLLQQVLFALTVTVIITLFWDRFITMAVRTPMAVGCWASNGVISGLWYYHSHVAP